MTTKGYVIKTNTWTYCQFDGDNIIGYTTTPFSATIFKKTSEIPLHILTNTLGYWIIPITVEYEMRKPIRVPPSKIKEYSDQRYGRVVKKKPQRPTRSKQKYPVGKFREHSHIWSRDGMLKGDITGTTRPCTLTGCNGVRVTVRWPDGQITYPCTRGLTLRTDGELQII